MDNSPWGKGLSIPWHHLPRPGWAPLPAISDFPWAWTIWNPPIILRVLIHPSTDFMTNLIPRNSFQTSNIMDFTRDPFLRRITFFNISGNLSGFIFSNKRALSLAEFSQVKHREWILCSCSGLKLPPVPSLGTTSSLSLLGHRRPAESHFSWLNDSALYALLMSSCRSYTLLSQDFILCCNSSMPQ